MARHCKLTLPTWLIRTKAVRLLHSRRNNLKRWNYNPMLRRYRCGMLLDSVSLVRKRLMGRNGKHAPRVLTSVARARRFAAVRQEHIFIGCS